MNITSSAHYHGHRKRLRRRLLDSKPHSLPEYEILEILLFSGNARQDVKPLAKTLIQTFGSLAHVLSKNETELLSITGMNETHIAQLRAVNEAALYLIKSPLEQKIDLTSLDALVHYLKASMASLRTECYRVLYVSSKLQLIADDIQPSGDIDSVAVYPRQLMKRALELQARGIILSHNHPSGDPTPSNADITLTQRLHQACQTLDINFHDHIIIAAHGYVSLRENGLLG